jgi:hypothetical protein
VSVNGTLIEAKMCIFTLESTHFIFNKCPIYTHDDTSAKLSTNSHETDYSAAIAVTPEVAGMPAAALEFYRDSTKNLSNGENLFCCS